MNAKVSATASDDDEADKTSAAAQAVASIDDLLIQILLSIPLKPLFRLKLVSKHWNFIISDNNFNLLRNQNPNPAVGLVFIVAEGRSFRPSSYVVSFEKATNGPQFREIKINSSWPFRTHHFPLCSRSCTTLNSCNGLLLCKVSDVGTDANQIYYVCNPTTNKQFTLPKVELGVEWDWYFIYRMCLAFDPSKSPHFKVVCVVTVHDHPTHLQVYSSETGSWIKHSDAFSGCADFCRGVYWNGGIYWNGAIHWISTGKVLYFNPDNDLVLQVLPTPPMTARKSSYPDNDRVMMPTPPMITPPKRHGTYWSRNRHYLGESCGHLHYIEDDKAVMELNVYEMRTDYSEWFLKYRVDCSLIDNRLASIICALVQGKKDEDSFLVLQSEERIIRYNLLNKTCETICELDAVGASFDWALRFYREECPLPYIESLSPLQENNTIGRTNLEGHFCPAYSPSLARI